MAAQKGAAHKGSENLIPTNKRSKDEVRRNARKGGIKSGQVRREKADFKRKCQIWMDETVVAHDENGKPLTGSELMIAVAARGIMDGSPEFWKIMRDTAGYKPVDKVMVAEVEQDTINEVESMVLGNNGTEQEAEDGQQGCE